MVAFTLLGFLLVGWTLNDCSFYGFWITLLATFLIFLPIIPEKVKLSEKITTKRAELPKPETTKIERMGEKQRENEIKKRAVEMTLISKSLNTMALFIFAISFLFPLASLGNTGGMQYILLMSSVKIRPSHDLGFYPIVALFIWLISYFTNKLENKLADQIICR